VSKEYRSPSLERKFLWLMGLRVVIITTLLGIAIAIQTIHQEEFLAYNPLYYIIGLTYLLTIIYALFFNYIKESSLAAHLQIVGDLLIISFLVYITGGVGSSFSFLYLISIISASIILFRRGALLMASLSGIFYCSLIYLMYHQIIPASVDLFQFPQKEIYYNVFLNLFGFFTIALLSSYLSENLEVFKLRLEKKSKDFVDLQAFNQHIIDCMSSGLITTDLKGKIIFLNKAAEQITGYRRNMVKGKDIFEMFDGSRGYLKVVKNKLAKKRVFRFERYFNHRTGKRLFIGMSATRLMMNGDKESGYIFIFQDLTTLKRLEEEVRIKDRMAAIGEMAAGIAHEIRNPLAAMSGSVQMLEKDRLLSPEQQRLMDIILKESERLNLTISNFLQYAKPAPSQPVPTNIWRLLQETLTLLNNSEERHPNHHIIPRCPNPGLTYFCDPNQMKQVFWNLATNALKAMPNGGNLVIELGANKKGGLTISFKDEGIGISDEDIERLFQPFSGSFRRGTGLGMAIVYRIVKDHQGRIKVKKGTEKGTELIVYLPPIGGEEGKRQSINKAL